MSQPTPPCRVQAALSLLCGLVLVPAAGVLEAQEVDLSWRFLAGDELRYEQTQTNVSSTPMGSISATQTTVLSKRVLDVQPDGAAELRVTYESLRAVQEGPQGRQEFDSDGDGAPSDPGMALAAGLVGQGFDLTMGPRGEIRGVGGIDALLGELLEGMTAAGAPADAELREMLEAMFGEEQMASLMQQGVHSLPAGSVGVGATWGDELVLSLPFGSVRSEYEYALEEIVTEAGSTRARISMTGSIGELELGPDNPMAGMMSLSGGDLGGELLFDVDRGLLLHAEARSTMALSAMGQEMPVETTQIMRLIEP